jgi:hypothetical protein
LHTSGSISQNGCRAGLGASECVSFSAHLHVREFRELPQRDGAQCLEV